uniref:Uncharacterized protein n=1 Tax=Chromera velia CCMP2878 TaxID=1169474 RepID=A0A0G4H8R0_9ALVE|eukprot:Cvel_25104.t1-p1 / transcript=Cvel_25104.t1 / gene=Cvel_25104 / organism=Chromera_velia_CCMP2878 / gene_product=hypothetical protein / transcript_product=hypothetical protein / location=Cvel_scaffold2801:949-1659(-) / protein_length=237 / sequence_SO=supercontig / SO=protein_coding / is_pseudo=false
MFALLLSGWGERKRKRDVKLGEDTLTPRAVELLRSLLPANTRVCLVKENVCLAVVWMGREEKEERRQVGGGYTHSSCRGTVQKSPSCQHKGLSRQGKCLPCCCLDGERGKARETSSWGRIHSLLVPWNCSEVSFLPMQGSVSSKKMFALLLSGWGERKRKRDVKLGEDTLTPRAVELLRSLLSANTRVCLVKENVCLAVLWMWSEEKKERRRDGGGYTHSRTSCREASPTKMFASLQ